MDNSFLKDVRIGGAKQQPKGSTPSRPDQSQEGLENWLREFEGANSSPARNPARPEPIADQIAAMPNSEKLSPIENWLYKSLPGFSESTVGKALVNFGNTPAGKVLAKLDVLAEGLERTLGVIAQYRDKDPNETFRLKDAWAAGSLFYDTARLPRIKYSKDGWNIEGIQMDTTLPGAYAVTEARKLLEQGKTLEEVRELLYSNLGALAIRSQLQDSLGHIALDPLNWVLGAIKPVERLHAIRNLALTQKLDPQAVRAMEQAARLSGDLESANKFAEAIAQAEASGKALTRLDRLAINITGGIPYMRKTDAGYVLRNVDELSPKQSWLDKVNPFALTPQARASELLDVVAANVGEHLIRPNWNKDPEEFIAAVSRAARGSIGNEWGHIASTIQGRTLQGFLAQADGTVKTLAKEWATYGKERTLLQQLSGLMGTDPRKLWQMARKNPDKFMRDLAEAAMKPGGEWIQTAIQRGDVPPDFATQIAKIDKSVPLLHEEFYTKALVSMQDVAMRQSILQFGIKEKGILTKWSDALKAWETLPFIKANPANAIRNVVNNDITLIGRGLYGTMSRSAIDDFWKGKWMPPQFQRGFGFSGDVTPGLTKADEFDAGNAIQQMVDVLEGKGGMATKFKDAAQGIDLKAFDFSKFSAKWEAEASKRAATNGWMQFHQQYWNPRTGFTSVSKSVDSATLERMEELMPGIAETLDDVAQQSMGDATKFAELMQSNIEHNITGIFKNASDRIGYKVEDVLGTELTHTIQEGLPNAIQQGKVREFVDGVRLQMEQHVDDMFAKHVENLPGIVAAQVQAGGGFQFHRIFGKATDELWGGNIEHARRMSTINELMDYARQSGDYSKVSSLWSKIQADGESHFRRIWSKFEAYQKGLQEGAVNAGLKYPDEVATAFQGIRSGWDEFFKTRNSEYKKFFDSIGNGHVPKKQLDAIQEEMDGMYNKLIKDEDSLFQQIDDLMAKQLPDKVQRKMYMNYRDKAAQLRVEDKTKTAEFFKRIRRVSREDAPDMWQQFWNERMNRLEQMRQLDAAGSAAIQGDEASTAKFFGGVTDEGTEPQNIFELASRYDIASTTKAGKRNDRRVLSTVNKYSKQTSATDVQIVDNAKLPVEVKNAFRVWDEAKRAVKEAQKADLEDVVAKQEAIKTAKEVEKIARQQYNNALQQTNIDGNMIDKLLKERTFMDAENIPMNVAKEAFEAQKASKVGQATQAAKDQGFIPDAEKMFPDPMPVETALSELNYGRSYAAMDALVEETLSSTSKQSRLVKDLPEDIQKKIMQWGKQVEGESNSFRAAGVQYAAFRRDSALLNYNRRTNFDNWLGHMAPFAFWSTHSIANWVIHSMDRPAMLTSYFRAREFFETAGLSDQKVPKRLKGNIRVPLPFTPDWMGDTFVNPMRFLLPFDGFMMPWEQSVQGKFTTEQKTMDTLNQMVEQGLISEDEYEQAVNDKSGEAWDAAEQQVKEGGDQYDAMDFVSMTMTPHAPLMWAYNAMRGEKSDIGPFTPLSRTTKNVATMLGVEDWSNSPYNIEGRIRKSLGLPAYDKWDDYRISRSIANIAVEKQYDMKDVKEAMEVAALVEAGKMPVEEAKKVSKVYKEAIRRTNQEVAGGWAGTVLGALGIPVRAYPEGEQAQRELADQFGKAMEARDRGDVEALSKFFDEYPEYEARLALFKSPEERLKNFMVDNIWSRFNSLPKVQRDEVSEQLGPNFQTYFLDKQTQSYDALTPEQLNLYLKLMGGDVVGKLTATEEALVEFNQLKLTEPETAWRVQTFYDSRKSEFPGWYDVQQGYFERTTEAAKAKYKRENPELQEYWDFRRQWMEQNPDLVRFLTDDEKQLKKYEKMQRDPEVAVPTAQEIRANFSPETTELVQQWTQGQSLPPQVDGYMEQLAEQYGLTKEQLAGILGAQP